MTTSSSTGVAIASSTVLSVTFPEACSEPWPGGMIGPTRKITSGVAISEATTQIVVKRRPWLGSPGTSPEEIDGLDDIQEPVHVAQRLHRTAEAVEKAGGAGDEALPVVAAFRPRSDAEFDRAVGGSFAGREFALVLGFFRHPGE